jgi:hypothetical protein
MKQPEMVGGGVKEVMVWLTGLSAYSDSEGVNTSVIVSGEPSAAICREGPE